MRPQSGQRLSFQGTVACSAMVSRGFAIRTRPEASFFICFHIYIDFFAVFLYSYSHLFPDCVMVALQILVLTVGVRILLGEIKRRLTTKSQLFFCKCNLGSFEYRFSSSPSQGGETGSTPVGAKGKS